MAMATAGRGKNAVSLFVDGSQEKMLVLQSASVKRFAVSCMRDFFLLELQLSQTFLAHSWSFKKKNYRTSGKILYSENLKYVLCKNLFTESAHWADLV